MSVVVVSMKCLFAGKTRVEIKDRKKDNVVQGERC